MTEVAWQLVAFNTLHYSMLLKNAMMVTFRFFLKEAVVAVNPKSISIALEYLHLLKPEKTKT